ncbi:PREDICTED: protein kinase C-binding protein 1 isoform X1 [Wasmannia auropunctata]|uniref:protein kinase C-binding protein 1 isoform X1 n=1 Tax=Wasmannia auropunctata TaxID=64793 RepID=UPI0005ED8BE5|nr:PREDICTED: protein kinase C-binding protein 1 isoform X1 [Wasmannia auropunctata]
MASNESSKDSVKSSVGDKVNSMAQSNADEKKSPTASPPVDSHTEPSDTAADAKDKNLMSDTTECITVEKNSCEDVKNENKDDLKSLVVDGKQDDSETDKKQEVQNVASLADPQSTDEEKEVKRENSKDTPAKGASVLKRKRKTVSNPPTATVESSVEESGTRSKRKKLKAGYDRFCWRCHKEKVDAYCTACPRSWHRKCIGGMPPSLDKWICGECATILKAENAETRSIAMAQLSVDQLCMLLKHVVERLRDYPGSEPFCKPVDLTEVPNYLDYVVKPMDLSLLESNVRAKLYGSTDAFMADAKWIQHNCIVFNTCGGVYTDTSKLTNASKQIIKVVRQEVSEIEACPDCYAHGRNLPRPQPSWFIEPCRRPHPLVWAKLKGFPFWPAKAMPRVNSQGCVDVRFFGEHDRAWVPPKDLFLYSEEPPAPSPRKRKSDMDECVQEITRHCRKLALMFGQFKFAPAKVQYDPNDPMQIQLMLPNYNPLEPNNHFPKPEFSTPQKKKAPQKKRSVVRGKSQSDESADIGEIDPYASEKESEGTLASKVQKLDTNVTDTLNSQIDVDDSHSKLNKRADQMTVKSPPQQVAQKKTVRDGRSRNASTSRLNVTLTDNADEDNSTSPDTCSSSDKNNLPKAKNEKSSTKNAPKTATQSVTESPDASSARVQKRTLLKNIINPKLALSQMDNSKATTTAATTKYTKNNKVFKPKTRMVDKMNAEKELKRASPSKENEKQSNSSKVSPRMSLNSNKESSSVQKNITEIDLTLSSTTSKAHTIPSANAIVPITDKSVLLLVVNGKSAEPAKQIAPTIDYQGNKDATKEGHNNSPPKKQSKARKSFPCRLHNLQNVQRLSDTGGITTQVSPVNHETSSTYQLLPPEAGPISARLHHDAHALARKMGHLMEEAYKEAAQENVNGDNGTADSYQATVFFLRMQIEHIKWQHQQQLAELKHNADRTLREMRASLEAEKLRAVEEARKEIEEEKIRCVEETKRKQWCAKCGQEAMFYCCWNTAYCNYPCQQSHWPTHMRTCSQQSAYATIVNSGANSNSQQSNNVVTQDSTRKTYLLSPNKLSGIPPSSVSSLRNKASQDAL